MLPIKAFERMSLIDYTPYSSCVVFIGGCNFRCPYCHNADMVNASTLPDIREDELLEFLQKRKGWLDAVVFTGGEPTLYPDIRHLIEPVKSMGYLVKLDTNGAGPQLLKELLPMLDYVAMDIKGPKSSYEEIAKASVDMGLIEQSIRLTRQARDYEFRTTVVKDFFTMDNAPQIGEWLKGSRRYVLQQYRGGKTLDPEFDGRAYTTQELMVFKDLLRPYFEKVEVRGV